MTSICQRLQEAAGKLPLDIALASVAGCLFGYVYAKFADLPVRMSMKAYVIWGVTEEIFKRLASTLTSRPSKQALIQASVNCISTTIGLIEIQRRGLVGKKMVAFMCFVTSVNILCFCSSKIFYFRYKIQENDTYDSIAQEFGVSKQRISELNNFDLNVLPTLEVDHVLIVDSLFK